MQLSTEFLQLPLRFDAARLAAEVAGFDESDWRPHPQGNPGNSALPLVAVGGDPGDDATRGPMRPTPHLARMPYARQVLAAIGGVVGRSRLMRLDGHAEATPHTDTNHYWVDHLRVHVPVATTPRVVFECGERQVHMAAGECWVFDTWRRHNVVNPDGARRIHLVVDTVGSEAFDALLSAARDPFAAATRDWTVREVAFEADLEARFALESFNHPGTMGPWELATHLRRVVAELRPAPGADAEADVLRASARRLEAGWRGAWAEHGPGSSGHAVRRALLARFAQAVEPLAGRLRLHNGVDTVEALRQFVLRAALDEARPAAGGAVAAKAAARRAAARDPFAEPVFIVCPPRSGSSLLFETLAQSPDVATIGGESHAVIEGIPALDPAQRGFDSNRLFARDATPEVVQALRARFAALLRDRDGRPPGQRPLRLLEKTPKNALRVTFLAEAFPGARFVYLYRDARETLSSMLDAWKSGRFATYPRLPDWPGPPWSLLLTPGWREWRGQPLAEIVARQWSATVRLLLDELEALPPERWCVASYDRLVESPQPEVARLCEFLGIGWDRPLTAPLPRSKHTLTSPDPGKWRHNAAELEPVMELAAPMANRAHAVFAQPPATRSAARRETVASAAQGRFDFRSVHTSEFAPLLARLGGSLAVSTYQSGRLVLLRADGERLNTHLRFFPNPMGIAWRGHELALGTLNTVWHFMDQPAAAAALPPAGRHDACFVPARGSVTGDIRVHELAFAGEELWVVATRFSCLATLDGVHSFVPRWRPRFVSALAAEDRCHLNGLAMRDGRPRYASALGESDAPQGWRERKADGGCVIDVDSGESVARGLCMPHSPRWHDGRLWVLESGRGALATVEPGSGRLEVVALLPGFARGLAFAGPYAFVGLSQVRESIFDGIPVAAPGRERACGVWVVDTRSGGVAAFLRFEGDVREIFDVQFLAGLRWPEVVEPGDERVGAAFLLPA